MAISKPFPGRRIYPGGGTIISPPTIKQIEIDMLAKNCDLDDIERLQDFLYMLSKLSISDPMAVSRYQNSDTGDYHPFIRVLS